MNTGWWIFIGLAVLGMFIDDGLTKIARALWYENNENDDEDGRD